MTALPNDEVDFEPTFDSPDVAYRETKRLEQLRDQTRIGIDLDVCGLSRVVEVLQNLRPNPRSVIGQVQDCLSPISKRDRQ